MTGLGCSLNPLDWGSCASDGWNASGGKAINWVQNNLCFTPGNSKCQPIALTVVEHLTISYGGCFYVCGTATFQDGTVSLSVGCCGLLGRGFGVGWANQLPTLGWNGFQYMAGGAYYGGAGATIGMQANSPCPDWGNWSVSAFPGFGWYGGVQGTYTFQIPGLPPPPH